MHEIIVYRSQKVCEITKLNNLLYMVGKTNVTEQRIQRSGQKNSPGISKKVQGQKQILQNRAQRETHYPGSAPQKQRVQGPRQQHKGYVC
jgi:hypothetical protein